MNADLAGARAPLAPPLRAAAAPSSAPLPASSASRPGRALAGVLLLVAFGAFAPSAAFAQSGTPDPLTMTVEELEAHLEQQKAALELVRENRDITAEKAREVREALAEREAARAETEAELDALCREREEIEPGSYDDCAAQARD